MIRTLVAAAALASALATPASAGPPISVTPGCDNPVDVVCNEGYCPDHACTPIICLVWVKGRCVV